MRARVVSSQPSRDWSLARDKLTYEGSRCRVCKSQNMVQCAHVIGREQDKHPTVRSQQGPGEWKPYEVAPDRIVPLCKRCHDDYDAHRLDLLPYLSLWEVLQAVTDSSTDRSNGLENARIRITGRVEIPA